MTMADVLLVAVASSMSVAQYRGIAGRETSFTIKFLLKRMLFGL
jgi:hypothetical protein